MQKIKAEEKRLIEIFNNNFNGLMCQDMIMEFADKYNESEIDNLPDIVLSVMFQNIISKVAR